MANRGTHQQLSPQGSLLRPAQPQAERRWSGASRDPLLQQQAAVGNQAVQRWLRSQLVQAKLTVNEPDDAYEREADRVADEVLRMEPATDVGQRPRISSIQRVPEAVEEAAGLQPAEEDERKARLEAMRALEATLAPEEAAELEEEKEEEEEPAQAKRNPGRVPEVTPGLESRIARAARSGGRPLPAPLRDYFEPRFGRDLSGVRLHDQSAAAAAARQLDAQAFTRGRDIFFAAGRYQPQTQDGRRLLAHELTHTIQQQPGPRVPPAVGLTAAAVPQAAAPQPAPSVARLQRAALQRQETDSGSEPAVTNDPQVAAPSPQAGGPDVDLTASPPVLTLDVLNVPAFKADAHRAAAYSGFRDRNHLFRAAAYLRGEPNQARVWENEVNPAGGAAKLRAMGMRDDGTYIIDVSGKEHYRRVGTPEIIARGLVRPYWKRSDGKFEPHDVDHIVELQVSGWPRITEANALANMEMLESSINRRSGTQVRVNIESAIKEFLNDPTKRSQLPAPYHPSRTTASNKDVKRIKSDFDVKFRSFRGAGGDDPTSVSYYKSDEVREGKHLDYIKPKGGGFRFLDLENTAGQRGANTVFSSHRLNDDNVIGSAEKFVIYSTSSGGRAYRFNWTGVAGNEKEVRGAESRRIRGLRIQRMWFTPEDPESVGRIQAHVFYGQRQADGGWISSQTNELYSWPIRRYFNRPGPVYAGYLETRPLLAWIRRSFGVPFFSPITFSDAFVDEETGLTALGKIHSTLPILPNVEIDIRLQGDDLRIEKHFSRGEFDLPGPMQVDRSDLLLSLGIQSGLEASGRVEFSIERIGQGFVAAAVGTNRSLRLAGGFSFDTGLFDPAEIEVTYEDNQFSAQGRLGIPEGKVRGIKSANIEAAYEQGQLDATGTVEPDIPGVQQGTVTLSYSEAEGLTIGGTLELSDDIPGIESGSLSVELRQREGEQGFAVSAAGEAKPSIPGVDASLSVEYDDGALTIGGRAAYERGMLSGTLEVGATNRALDAEGNPTGEPTDALTAYGGGTVTIRIAPWLQGTIGLRLLPNGEMEVTGSIGLPSALEIFPEKSVERNIFSIGIDIPIVGVAVAGQRIGIFATVRGGLDLSAGVGPGQLRELGLSVTYNPDREQETRVSGGAQLHIPAHAGLRLFVRGGLGVGIPIVSATASVEIGGQLGLEGALQAGVQVEWTPATGLVLDAFGEIYVEPKLKFDVAAMVQVEADLVLTTVELYSKRWDLAQFEFGSGLRFGIKFPVHYQEGQPFEISWDDVEFEVPEIDTDEVLAGLFRRITQ